MEQHKVLVYPKPDLIKQSLAASSKFLKVTLMSVSISSKWLFWVNKTLRFIKGCQTLANINPSRSRAKMVWKRPAIIYWMSDVMLNNSLELAHYSKELVSAEAIIMELKAKITRNSSKIWSRLKELLCLQFLKIIAFILYQWTKILESFVKTMEFWI